MRRTRGGEGGDRTSGGGGSRGTRISLTNADHNFGAGREGLTWVEPCEGQFDALDRLAGVGPLELRHTSQVRSGWARGGKVTRDATHLGIVNLSARLEPRQDCIQPIRVHHLHPVPNCNLQSTTSTRQPTYATACPASPPSQLRTSQQPPSVRLVRVSHLPHTLHFRPHPPPGELCCLSDLAAPPRPSWLRSRAGWPS